MVPKDGFLRFIWVGEVDYLAQSFGDTQNLLPQRILADSSLLRSAPYTISQIVEQIRLGPWEEDIKFVSKLICFLDLYKVRVFQCCYALQIGLFFDEVDGVIILNLLPCKEFGSRVTGRWTCNLNEVRKLSIIFADQLTCTGLKVQ